MKLSRSQAFLTLLLPTVLAPSLLASWPTNPSVNLPVCDAPGDQAVPKSVAGGDGTTWIAWFDHRGANYDVYAQKLDANGNEVFANDGLLISANTQNSSLVDWGICSDGAGGCALVFTDVRATGDLDVYAYRIDGAGTFLWGANGVTLSANADFEANPRIALLSDGAFAVSWQRSPSSGAGAIHHQRISAAGALQFAGDGNQIVGAGSERPGFADVVGADAGGYIITYIRNTTIPTGIKHLYAQKIDSAGSLLWNAGAPLPVYDAASLPIAHQPILQADGAGGAYFAWHVSVGGFFEARIQRVNSAGTEVFPHNGVQVSTEASRSTFDPKIAQVTGGDVVVVFNKRNSGQSIWASCVQRIDPTGALLWTNDGIEFLPYDTTYKQFERIAPYGNDAIVFSCEATNGGSSNFRILAARVDAAGAMVWTPGLRVVTDAIDPITGNLAGRGNRLGVVNDASGVVRAAWADDRDKSAPTNDPTQIYAQNIHGDGSLGPAAPGVPYCFGDGSGTPCPCTPVPLVGDADKGCPNSFNAGGGKLTASGVASIGADTLVMTCTTINNGGAVVFQGTNDNGGGLGTAFGDGLRCAAGTVRRMKSHAVTTNTHVYPDPMFGDNAISIRGAVLASGDRWYQGWYRSGLAHCNPAENYNLTNGVKVTWSP